MTSLRSSRRSAFRLRCVQQPLTGALLKLTERVDRLLDKIEKEDKDPDQISGRKVG